MKHSFKTTFTKSDAEKKSIVNVVAGSARRSDRYAGFVVIYIGDVEIEFSIDGGTAARELAARLRETADRLEALGIQDRPAA